MKTITQNLLIRIALFVIPFVCLNACAGDSSPSNEDIQQIITTESVFSKNNNLTLKDVTVHSISKEGNNLKARITILFNSSRGGRWANEGTGDPIPTFTKIQSGENSLDATALFAQSNDGKWHLDKFVQ
jgi:hypothetical protein